MAWGGSEDLIGPALSEALAPVVHLELEWDAAKLEKRIAKYFRSGAKGLEFDSKPWSELVEEYADKVFASIFQALSDRHWLSQADFLFVLDAGVKETFPPEVLGGVPQNLFERAVLNANDRAFEEQRYLPMLWDTITEMLQGPKIKKKAYDAFEEGRKNAAGCTGDEAGSSIGTFLQAWVHNTIARLAETSNGMPDSILEPQTCAHLFHALVGRGAMPLPLVYECGEPPEGWPFIDQAVGQAYAHAGCGMPMNMKGVKGKGKGKASGKASGKAPRSAAPRTPPMGPAPPSKAAGRGGFGKAGGKAAGGADNGTGTKRALEVPDIADAKRPRAGGKGKAGGVEVKNPHCVQQEDCVGTAETDLVQHVDGDVAGDVYCSACWNVFAEADPSLTATPYETPA